MNPQLSQRSSLVLLAALAIALACGLLAAGPWQVHPEHLHFADQRAWGPLPSALNVLCSLPLTLAGLLGALALHRAHACPDALRHPYGAFFALAGSSGLLSAAFHLSPGPAAFVAIHVLEAAGCGVLMLAFLAERVDARWGAPWANVAAMAAACAGGLWWWALDGDLRPLVWLESLPVLLLGAGLLVLPCHYSCNADWSGMLLAYVAARALEAADGWLFDATGVISGHSLMHLGMAVATALLARRLWLSARQRPRVHDAGSPSLRATSFHTAG